MLKIKLIAKASSEKLIFDKMWIGNEEVKITIERIGAEMQAQNTFEKGDSIYINAYQRFIPQENGALALNKEQGKPVPIIYEGKAIISYQYKGKNKHWIIDDFKVLPKIYYP